MKAKQVGLPAPKFDIEKCRKNTSRLDTKDKRTPQSPHDGHELMVMDTFY